MYYTSAHSSLKSDLKFRTLLLPSVGSIFSIKKWKTIYFFQKMVSQSKNGKLYIFPKNGFSIKKWKTIYFFQKMVSQSKNGKLYIFSKKWFLNQKNGKLYIFSKKWFLNQKNGFPKNGLKMVSQSLYGFPLNGFQKKWFLNQKMVSITFIKI